jgi:hypothetical protein
MHLTFAGAVRSAGLGRRHVAPMRRQTTSIPHLLERERELEALGDAVARTREGAGSCFVIEGPAGSARAGCWGAPGRLRWTPGSRFSRRAARCASVSSPSALPASSSSSPSAPPRTTSAASCWPGRLGSPVGWWARRGLRSWPRAGIRPSERSTACTGSRRAGCHPPAADPSRRRPRMGRNPARRRLARLRARRPRRRDRVFRSRARRAARRGRPGRRALRPGPLGDRPSRLRAHRNAPARGAGRSGRRVRARTGGDLAQPLRDGFRIPRARRHGPGGDPSPAGPGGRRACPRAGGRGRDGHEARALTSPPGPRAARRVRAQGCRKLAVRADRQRSRSRRAHGARRSGR